MYIKCYILTIFYIIRVFVSPKKKMFGHGQWRDPDNGPARGPTTDKVAWLVQKSGDNYESNQFLDK